MYTFESSGELLGHLCKECGSGVYQELEQVLENGIKENLERDQKLVGENPELIEKLSGGSSPSPADEDDRVRSVVCACEWNGVGVIQYE